MQIEPIEIEVDGFKLRGNFYKPANQSKKLAMLFLHGWTGQPNDDAAKVLAENGFHALTIGLGGHGQSDGKIENQTRQKSLNEVMAVYDFLVKNVPKGTKICVTGNSYGGYLAPLLTEERDIRGLSMRVPANYPDEGFSERHKGHEDDWITKWRKESIGISQNRALKAVNKFQGQVQIIEAEDDDLVPHQAVQNYVDAVQDKSKLEYHLMKGWPHSLGMDEERNHTFQQLLLTWLQKQ